MKPQRADSIFVGTFSEIEAAIKGNPYHDEIIALLARAESFCADIPEGDNRRLLVPTIKSLCGLIPGELHFAATLANIPERDRMVAESSRRLDAMLGNVRELLFQAQALGLAQDVGKLLEPKRKGGRATAKVTTASKGITKSRVLAVAAQLRAQGVKERNIVAKTADKINLTGKNISVRTVRYALKPS